MENTVFERNYEIVEKDDRATAVFERAFAPGGFMEEFTKKMDAIPKVVVPKDKENYDYLLNRCDDYAKRHHGRLTIRSQPQMCGKVKIMQTIQKRYGKADVRRTPN